MKGCCTDKVWDKNHRNNVGFGDQHDDAEQMLLLVAMACTKSIIK